MPHYEDLGDLPEDRRITQIGQTAMTGKTVAFVTDDDPGKADRYIRKLLARFPDLEEFQRFNGPIPGAITIKVRKKEVIQ